MRTLSLKFIGMTLFVLAFLVGGFLNINKVSAADTITETYNNTGVTTKTIALSDIPGFNSSIPAANQAISITIDGKTTTYTIKVESSYDSVMTTFKSISDTLRTYGIENNLDTVTSANYKNFLGLYLEKRTDIKDPKTVTGKVMFNSPLDLSSAETISFLQNIETKIEMSQVGVISFDFSGTTDSLSLKNTNAVVSFYGLNKIGFSASSTSTDVNSRLIGFDDNRNILDKATFANALGNYLGSCEVNSGCYVYTIPVNHLGRFTILNNTQNISSLMPILIKAHSTEGMTPLVVKITTTLEPVAEPVQLSTEYDGGLTGSITGKSNNPEVLATTKVDPLKSDLSGREKIMKSLAASAGKAGTIVKGPMSIWIILLIIIILLGGGYGVYGLVIKSKPSLAAKTEPTKPVNPISATPSPVQSPSYTTVKVAPSVTEPIFQQTQVNPTPINNPQGSLNLNDKTTENKIGNNQGHNNNVQK